MAQHLCELKMQVKILPEHLEKVVLGQFPHLRKPDCLGTSRIRKLANESGLSKTLSSSEHALDEFLTIRAHDKHLYRPLFNLIVVGRPITFVKQDLVFPKVDQPGVVLL